MTEKRSIEEFAEAQAAEVHAENQGIARANRVLRGELAGLHERLAESEQEMAALQKEIALYEHKYTQRPDWLRATKKKAAGGHGTLVAFFSDAHYGEVVRSAELAGYNAYDLTIAEGRTARFFERRGEGWFWRSFHQITHQASKSLCSASEDAGRAPLLPHSGQASTGARQVVPHLEQCLS